MCRKKTITDQPAFTDRTVTGIVVGNYPGTANDLAGPVPDFEDLKKEILSRWPDMTYRGFKDSEATRSRFLSELTEAVNHVGEDGMLFFIMDTCHAESSTRNGGLRSRRRKAFRAIGYDKVLVFSSSLSTQSSSDAQFSDGANGAWHYALLKTMAKGITYRQWFDNAKALLAKAGFDQIPVIEGPEHLQNRLIFEGNVITVQVSSHGGQVADQDGDEPDKLDEIIYFYDRSVRDDEIRKILEKTKRRIFANNKQIFKKMKAKSFREKRDWKQTWLQTALSIVALVFTVLVSFGIITPEQMTEAQPLVNSTLGGIAAVIAGVAALIGIFAKQDEPVA